MEILTQNEGKKEYIIAEQYFYFFNQIILFYVFYALGFNPVVKHLSQK